MPKLKTRKAAAKRFSATGTGKIKRMKANKGHLTAKKNRKRKRGLRKATYADQTNVKAIKRMLPHL